MKKILIIFILFFGIFSINKINAATCNPCNTTWTDMDPIYFNYGGCVGIEVQWQTQTCDGKCYFRVLSIFWPDDCGTPPSMSTLMYSADSTIITTSWADNCWPESGCTESIESHQDACWKWTYISTHPEGNLLEPCGQVSCCETHWMLCVRNGIRTYYITYQHVTDPCDQAPVGCSNNCPEIP